MSFKEFLTEAQFGPSTFTKALAIIEKRLTRLIGSKLYRYDGPDGVMELSIGGKKFNSYLYFTNNSKAFRINTFRYKIASIDVWKKYTTVKNPDFTMDLGEINSVALLSILDSVAKFIKSPKAETIPLYFLPESVSGEGLHSLTEAKRSTPIDFYNLCKNGLSGKNLESLEWDDINSVASAADVQVPTFIRGQKTGKGRWSVVPPGLDTSTGDVTDQNAISSAGKKGSDPILYIKVTAQDPVSKKFLSSGDNKEAQDLYAKIQDALSADQGNGNPSDKEIKNPDTLFGHLYDLSTLVARRKLNSLLVYGGAGTGKTFTVFKAIQDAGLAKGKDYIKLSGKATPVSVYQLLYKWRDGGVVIFDDLDSIWKDKDTANILKAVLDSNDERVVDWQSNRTVDLSRKSEEEKKKYMDDLDKRLAGGADIGAEEEEVDEDGKVKKAGPIKFPASFEFRGSIIFISNLKKEEFDSAVMSRSAKIDMSLTPEQLIARMRSVLPHLGHPDVPLERKEELVDHLWKMFKGKELEMLTFREYVKCEKILASGVPNWKDLMQYA